MSLGKTQTRGHKSLCWIRQLAVCKGLKDKVTTACHTVCFWTPYRQPSCKPKTFHRKQHFENVDTIFAPYSIHNFVFNPYFLSEFQDYEVREPELSSLFHVWDKGWTTQEFWFVFGKNNRFFSLRSVQHDSGGSTQPNIQRVPEILSPSRRDLMPIADLSQVPTLEICTAKPTLSLMVRGVHRNRRLKNVSLRIQVRNLLILSSVESIRRLNMR